MSARIIKNSVAVIIPYYNGSSTIERAVASVHRQTVPATEFLVVDDGSRPEESAKLEAIAAKLNFKVIKKSNGGQGSARNYGVAHTQSEYICFLDQDDYFLDNHISVLLKHRPRSDPHFGWVYGDLMEADGTGRIVRQSVVQVYSVHPKRDIVQMLQGDMFVLPSAALISRVAFDAVGGFDPQFTGYEDDDLFMRIFRAGFTNTFVPQPVTVWCIDLGSTSFSLKMSQSRMRYIRKLCNTFPDDRDRSQYYIRDCLFKRFYPAVLGEAIAAHRGGKSPRERKFARNRKEFYALLDEFTHIMETTTRLKFADRWRLKIASKIISCRSTFILNLARYTSRFLRWVSKKFA